MLELNQRPMGVIRGARISPDSRQPRKLLLALVLLLVALGGVVIKDRQFWFGSDDSSLESDGTETAAPTPMPARAPTSVPNTAHATPTLTAKTSKKQIAPKNQIAAAPAPAEPPATDAPTVTRTVLPPLDVEVVAGDKHHNLHPGSNTAKVEISRPGDAATIAAATDAADRERIPATAEVPQSYPLLAQQMRVQGSVVLQALIGSDGVIENLKVVSGPGILSSAAQQAVREWRFKPIVQNGQAVESQAKITVNFNIKIADGSSKTTIAESRPLIIESLAR